MAGPGQRVLERRRHAARRRRVFQDPGAMRGLQQQSDLDACAWPRFWRATPGILDPIEHAVLLIGECRAAASTGGSIPRRYQRSGGYCASLWRDRRPQIRQRRSGSRGAQLAAGRTLGALGPHAPKLSRPDVLRRIRPDRPLLPPSRCGAHGCGARASAMTRHCCVRNQGASWCRRPTCWSSTCTFFADSAAALPGSPRTGGESE